MERILILDAHNIKRQMVPGGTIDSIYFAAGAEEVKVILSNDPSVANCIQPGHRYKVRLEIEPLLREET